MYPNPGGFSQQGTNNPYPGQQQTHGTSNPYPSQGVEFDNQQPGYPPQQTPYPPQVPGFPGQPLGYPPQQIHNIPQGIAQPGGGAYASSTSLPYGLGPGMPPSQPSGYPTDGAAYPSQQPFQPCKYPPVGEGYHPLPPQSQPSTYPAFGAGCPPHQPYPYSSTQQQQHPQSSGSSPYPNLVSGYPGQPKLVSGNSVELSMACTNLKDQDVMSKSDPVCVLFEKRSGAWVETGRTEMISDCHHPRWQKKFIVAYNPQTTQELKFEIYDWDSKSQKLKKHDILGQLETSLGTIVSSPGKTFVSSLKKGGGGRITILAEEVNPNAHETARFQLMGYKLDSKDMFGKSDPYYNLCKKMSNGQWSLVYKSEVIKNNSNPKWLALNKPVTEICNGDYDRELKVEVFDYDSSGENDLIGEFVTNLRSLSTGVKNQSKYEVINPKKQRNKKSYKNSGTISVVQFNYQ